MLRPIFLSSRFREETAECFQEYGFGEDLSAVAVEQFDPVDGAKCMKKLRVVICEALREKIDSEPMPADFGKAMENICLTHWRAFATSEDKCGISTPTPMDVETKENAVDEPP